MKPVDLRNECWADVMERLNTDRLEVHAWLEMYGPCTVRELVAATARDINSVAPRVTELVQIGMAALVGKQGKRGIYKAIPPPEARINFEQAKAALNVQQELPLRAAI